MRGTSAGAYIASSKLLIRANNQPILMRCTLERVPCGLTLRSPNRLHKDELHISQLTSPPGTITSSSEITTSIQDRGGIRFAWHFG
jgi:hypothetical protein